MEKANQEKARDRKPIKSERRKMLHLLLHEQKTVQEIADYLNIYKNTVEKYLFETGDHLPTKEKEPDKDRGVHFGTKKQPYHTEQEMLEGLPNYGTISHRYKSTEMRKGWKLFTVIN